MRAFLLLILSIILFNTSCQYSCNCETDTSLITHNDSVIAVVDSINIWKPLGLEQLESKQKTSYRLLISPSYRCKKRVFNLKIEKDTAFISVQYFDTDSENKIINSPDEFETYAVSQEQVDNFESFLDECCFWTMRSDCEPTLDGTVWFLEAQKANKHSCSKRDFHLVYRKLNDSTFFAICDQMLKLAQSSYAEQKDINSKCWMRKD